MKKFILPLLCSGALLSGCNCSTKNVSAFEQCVNELTGKQVQLYAPIEPNNVVFRVNREKVYAVNPTSGAAAEWIGHGSIPLDMPTPEETTIVTAACNCSTKLFPQP